jgi:hypothetical protein
MHKFDENFIWQACANPHITIVEVFDLPWNNICDVSILQVIYLRYMCLLWSTFLNIHLYIQVTIAWQEIVFKNIHFPKNTKNDTFHDEIEQCVRNVDIILCSILNAMGRICVITSIERESSLWPLIIYMHPNSKIDIWSDNL